MKIFRNIFILIITFTLSACEIGSDLPYPVVYGQISEFEVEGQCSADGTGTGSAVIDKNARTVTIYVSDMVDITSLKINKISLTAKTNNPDVDYQDSPALLVDSLACVNFDAFPRSSFDCTSSDKGNGALDTRVDFSKEVKFWVTTHQTYEWTVKVTQVVNREVEVEGQVGNAVVDDHQHTIVIYVSPDQDLSQIKVTKFSIGGDHGTVTPDPTTYDSYNFSYPAKFTVTTGWNEVQYWTVMAFHTTAQVETTAQVMPRNLNATISGTKPNGETPVIEYRKSGAATWQTLPQSQITLSGTSYSATITGLTPATKYEYRVTVGETSLETEEFATVALQQMPNSSFDDWSVDASNSKLYCPWASGGSSYWDTGNRGATTVGNSNSIPSSETSTGSGQAAYLESKWIVLKFAAGNIFTGSYLKTDGTNGVLGFGRPFTAYPTKLSFDYKYKCEEVTKSGDDAYNYLIGRPDSASIYVALWHIGEGEYEEFQGEKFPIVIRTKPGAEQHLFSPDDPRVIAFGQLTQGKTVDKWTHETIEIKYKNTEKPTTHILVVASASKYGDFFAGGVGSTLLLDNMKLEYE